MSPHQHAVLMWLTIGDVAVGGLALLAFWRPPAFLRRLWLRQSRGHELGWLVLSIATLLVFSVLFLRLPASPGWNPWQIILPFFSLPIISAARYRVVRRPS